MIDLDERRHFSRAQVSFPVSLDPVLIEGGSQHTLVDVSLRGVSITPGRVLPEGAWCRLTVSLGEGRTQVRLVGSVVRATAEGVALAVCASDADSFGHLRALLCYNAEDPEMIDLELEAALRGVAGEA